MSMHFILHPLKKQYRSWEKADVARHCTPSNVNSLHNKNRLAIKTSSKVHFQSQSSNYCVKSVQIRSWFWSEFSRIRTEYGEILCISPYPVRKKLRIWTLFTQWILQIVLKEQIEMLNVNLNVRRNLLLALSGYLLKIYMKMFPDSKGVQRKF